MIHQSADNIRMLFDNKIDASDVHFTQEEVENALLENRERLNCLSHDIQSITTLFSEDHRVIPIQCRESVVSLKKAKQCVQVFHNLLDKPDRLPIIFSALRYRLIFQIHLIEKQAEQLIDFIESYRAICTYATSLVQRRRQIRQALQELLENISDLSRQTYFIKHEASFHQKRLTHDSKPTTMSYTLEEDAASKKQISGLHVQQ